MIIPANIERLAITIEGTASRTVSRLSDLIQELQASGMNEEAIRARITFELTQGTALAEIRNFASARAPGYVGDMVFRFARDTLSANLSGKPFVSAEEKRLKSINTLVEKADGTEQTRLEQIQDAYKRQGIDITAYTEDLPEPPPDAELTDRYQWVSVVDARTCSVCAGNHGKIETLGSWSMIGEPRSGACAGESNCRCILVPVSSLSKREQTEIKNLGPILIKK